MLEEALALLFSAQSDWQPVSGTCTPARAAGDMEGGSGQTMISVLPGMRALQGQGEEEEWCFLRRCRCNTHCLDALSQGRGSRLGPGST